MNYILDGVFSREPTLSDFEACFGNATMTKIRSMDCTSLVINESRSFTFIIGTYHTCKYDISLIFTWDENLNYCLKIDRRLDEYPCDVVNTKNLLISNFRNFVKLV